MVKHKHLHICASIHIYIYTYVNNIYIYGHIYIYIHTDGMAITEPPRFQMIHFLLPGLGGLGPDDERLLAPGPGHHQPHVRPGQLPKTSGYL